MIKFKKFSNGVVVCNTTPHPVTMQDVTGELVTVEPSEDFMINAKAKEEQVSPLFVKTVFEATKDGEKRLRSIERCFTEFYRNGEVLVVVGSIIAAQAYPGRVVAMTPVPGFERVAPSEKRMRCDKFTTF